MRYVVGFLLAALLPGLLFCGVAGARRGMCFDAYTWESGTGWVPGPATCDGDTRAELGRAAQFYGRATLGLVTGTSGRSREDASRPMAELLVQRARRSGGILLVAGLLLFAGSLTRRGVSRLLDTGERSKHLRALRRKVDALGPLTAPAGFPLPLAGLLVLAMVMRVVPPGSAWDYDRAGIVWAGLALALADGVSAVLARGLAHARTVERARPYAEAIALWGQDPEPAVADVSRGVRAAQVRGALLALLGGLLIVEGVFGVNGLGETLRDIVVDRRGIDPLLLSGVLFSFSLFVLVVEWLPLEQVLGGRP